MGKKDDNKHARPFNFGDSPLVKQTEQTIESGFEALEKKDQGGVEPQLETMREITASVPQQAVTVHQEPMQNINIPIPASQHTRLKIISAQTRQTMKDMVVQAIDLWLDVQEGKIKIVKGE